jgi:hypothetical protein
MLVMPEHTIEQRLNAAAVDRVGIGRQLCHTDVMAHAVERFLAEGRRYRGPMRNTVRDGRADALRAIERFASQLCRERGRRSSLQAWRFA